MGIRRRVFEHSMRNNGGYLSQACSAAEQLAFLYNEALNLGEPALPAVPRPFAGVPSADNPDYVTGAGYNGPFEPQYDRLFIAPAHYALVAYATLIETGRMDAEGPRDVQQGRLVGRDDRCRAFARHGSPQRHARHRPVHRRGPCLRPQAPRRQRPGLRLHVRRRGAGRPDLGSGPGRRPSRHRQSLGADGRQRPAMRRRHGFGHGGARHPGQVPAFGAVCVEIDAHDLDAMRQAKARAA
jgi:hypothetical protein